jgi:oligosaccharide repeat unit polymerase
VAFAFLAVNGYLAWKIRSAAPEIVGKSALLSAVEPGLTSQYRLSQATVIPTATLFIVADSVVARGKLTFGAVAYFACHSAVCFLTGERDVALIAAAWVACNIHQWNRKFLLTVVTALVMLVAVVPLIRAASSSNFGFETVAQSLLTRNSSNLLVFTNVTQWVPDEQPYFYGESYLDSVLNLIPGYPIGETLMSWFKRNYEYQGRSGFAFSMDAEAYVNFGWIGPAIVFLVWGAILGHLYRRSKVRTGVNTVFLWVLTLTSSIFAIRAFSLPLIKIAVYGAIGSRLLWFVAQAADQVRRRQIPATRYTRPVNSPKGPRNPDDPGLG